MNPAQALIALKTHPRKWLEQHYLITYAGIPLTFTAQQHTFGNIDMSGLGTGAVLQRTAGSQKHYIVATGKGTRTFAMHPTTLQLQFAPGIVQASVINVPVVKSEALTNGYAGLPLHDLGTALAQDYMVTTLLNGCCFVMDGGNPRVLHVQPTGGTTSQQLRTALAPHYSAVFGGGGHEYDHTVQDVTIVGIRRNAGWKIYAQVHGRNTKDVLRVAKIFG